MQNISARVLVTVLIVAVLYPLATQAQTEIEFFAEGGSLKLDIYNKIIESFAKKHPEIAVDFNLHSWRGEQPWWEEITLKIVSGLVPDVFNLPHVLTPGIMAYDILLDLTPLIERDEAEIRFDDFLVTGPSYKDGRYFGLATRPGFFLTNVNISRVEEAGLVSPLDLFEQGEWDWDALVTVAKRLTKVDSEGRYVTMGAAMWGWNRLYHSPWVQSAGGAWLDHENNRAAFNSPQALEAFRFLRQLVQMEVMPGRDYHGLQYARGDFGVVFSWEGKPTVKPSVAGWRYETVPVPAGPKGYIVTYHTPNHYVISKTTKHLEAAWSFLKHLASPESMELWIEGFAACPNRTSVLQDAYGPVMAREWGIERGWRYTMEMVSKGAISMIPTHSRNADIQRIVMDILLPGVLAEEPLDQAIAEAARQVTMVMQEETETE